MPQKDLYHDVVAEALRTDGWVITDDSLHLTYGGRNFYVDLGAERLLGAVKENQKIAIEIKSFIGLSEMYQLELAIGQYNLYRDVLSENELDRMLFLAVPDFAYWEVFNDPLGQLVIQRQRLNLIVFDEDSRRIVQWIP